MIHRDEQAVKEGLYDGIRAVVFDAVGTLIHPEPAAAVVYATVARRFGSRLTPAEIAPRFAAGFREEEDQDRPARWSTSEAREVRRWRTIVARVLDDVSDPEACFQTLFMHFRQPAAWRCAPEVGPTLEGLAEQGYLLGLASNYDERLRSVAGGLPALSAVDRLIISSEVGWRKPALEFFAAVCRTLNLAPEQILYVGDDWVNDYEGARAAGLRALLFDPTDAGPREAARISRLNQLLAKAGPAG